MSTTDIKLLQGLKKPEDKIRFDKNLAHSGIEFDKIYGNDGQLIYDIVVHLATDFQKNIFSYGEIDLVDFAKKSGQDPSNLQRINPNPAQLSYKGITPEMYQEIKESPDYNPNEWFLNNFENALYKLGIVNLALESKYKDFSTNEDILKVDFIQVIKNLEKITTRHNKSRYSFEISEAFTVSLSKYFINVNISPIEKKYLRGKTATYLYFYLQNVGSSLMQNEKRMDKCEARISFDHLCKVAKVNSKSFSDNKKRLRKKIYDIAMNTDLNVQLEFEKATPKSKYKARCVLTFPDNLNDVDSHETYNIIRRAFVDLYLYNLINSFRSKYNKRGPTNMDDFFSWYFSKEERDLKQETFDTIKTKIYGRRRSTHSVAPSINKSRIDEHIKEEYHLITS